MAKLPSPTFSSPSTDTRNFPHGWGSAFRLFLRVFQFILGLTVCGLYGVDLHRAARAHAYTDGRWVYAEVVGGLSAGSVFVYLIHWRWLVVWDFVLFILWTALFGIFGKIYIPAHPTPKQGGQRRMKNAVWVDLINMLLWFVTLCTGLVIFWMERGRKTLHTARADI